MANYNCFSRTTMFKTTDKEAVKALAEKIGAEFWDEGEVVGFGNYNEIDIYENEVCETIEVYKELQQLLPDGEAVIISEVGHEKLKYLEGYAMVITNKETRNVNLHSIASKVAADMLGTEFDLRW